MAIKPIPFGQGSHQEACSATSSHQDITALSIEQDVMIDIYPRGYDMWIGTSAQLIAEGLVPRDFKWPVGRVSRDWDSGKFRFWLARRRPDGHKGPMSSWLEIDYWHVRRTLIASRYDGFAAARIYEEQQALADELWRTTPDYREHWNRYWAAYKDEAFQKLKTLIAPEQKKRGRKPKAANTSPPASA